MSTQAVDITFTIATEVAARASAAFNATYDTVFKKTNNPRLAEEAGTNAAANIMSAPGVAKVTADMGFGFASDLLALFFKAISKFRHEETDTFDSTVVEVVNEFLGTELQPETMKAGAGGDETIKKANAIGKAVLDRLEEEFTGGGPVTMESGAQGARTFAGYGVNFAIQNAIISLLGACVPIGHMEDIRELGVEVAQNLGLGRLIRTALKPLVENTIAKPYSRQLQRKYRMDMLGAAELARAYLAGRFGQAEAMELLRQHGLSDEQITELIAQEKPRLHAEEWNLLEAMGQLPKVDDGLDDSARGMAPELAYARQRVLTWKRLAPIRARVLQAVLTQVSNGFLQPTDLDTLMAKLSLPQDEQDMWREAAGYLYERTRKRISHGDMLFLYEASQVTDEDVRAWLKAEGYSEGDVELELMVFRLKAVEASHKTTGGAGARAAHLHKEHVAWVTDHLTGLFDRKPTAAEVNYWVNLLDVGERTKADVTTELKGLDPSGSAIPATR